MLGTPHSQIIRGQSQGAASNPAARRASIASAKWLSLIHI